MVHGVSNVLLAEPWLCASNVVRAIAILERIWKIGFKQLLSKPNGKYQLTRSYSYQIAAT